VDIDVDIDMTANADCGPVHPEPAPDPVKVTQGRIWGDPHFVGADGGKYDVQGEAGKTYNILSDTGVQMNATFKEWNNPGTTVVEKVGITTAQGQIQINEDGSLLLDGEIAIPKGQAGSYLNGAVTVNDKGHITVKAGEYDITFDNFAKNDKSGAWINNIELRSENANSDGQLPSGLWGATVDGDGQARNGDRGKGTQGGGAIETLKGEITQKGDKETVKLYEVGSIFDVSFDNFNEFAGPAKPVGGTAQLDIDVSLDIDIDLDFNIGVVAGKTVNVADDVAAEKPVELPEMQAGAWFAKHGEYKKTGDGTYEITKGTYAGYTLRMTETVGKYTVFDTNDCAVGTYTSKNGKDKVASPIAFDMNRDGKIGVTGETTAKDGTRAQLGRTVDFDIDADGTLERIEWMSGDGDALLVDNRDGRAARDMDGARLFGDEGGRFSDGYQKLSQLDANGDAMLTAGELQGLYLWRDNGNAKVDAGEMISAQEAGVTRIATTRVDVENARGETLMQSSASVGGQDMLTEDVWFGKKS
ncbi:MAG: hypothetical protein AAF841_04680, partial [Pseudomonadota bacterium]